MSFLVRLFLAAGLSLALVQPLAAEDRSATFLTLMGQFPESVIANRSLATPRFVDHVAAAEVAAAAAQSVAGLEAGAWRMVSGPLADAPPGEAWRPTVGFAREDVLAVADNGLRDGGAMVLLLAETVLPSVGPALTANGYALSEERGFPAFWRGEDDGRVDLSVRAADDPFAYSIPLSSRIALEGDLLLQASEWPVLEAAVGSAGPSPALQAMARVLDLPDWGARRLVQATIFSDPTMFSPGIVMGEDLVPTVGAPGAVPYWSNLMIADLSDGASDLSLVVLIYAAKSDAEKAAEVMGAGMAKLPMFSRGDGVTLGDLIGSGRALVAGDGPYAAIYAVETAPAAKGPTMVENRGYYVLTSAAMTIELPLLGPAMP